MGPSVWVLSQHARVSSSAHAAAVEHPAADRFELAARRLPAREGITRPAHRRTVLPQTTDKYATGGDRGVRNRGNYVAPVVLIRPSRRSSGLPSAHRQSGSPRSPGQSARWAASPVRIDYFPSRTTPRRSSPRRSSLHPRSPIATCLHAAWLAHHHSCPSRPSVPSVFTPQV